MEENLFTDEAGNLRVKPCCTVITSTGQVKGAGEIVTILKKTKTEEVDNGDEQQN